MSAERLEDILARVVRLWGASVDVCERVAVNGGSDMYLAFFTKGIQWNLPVKPNLECLALLGVSIEEMAGVDESVGRGDVFNYMRRLHAVRTAKGYNLHHQSTCEKRNHWTLHRVWLARRSKVKALDNVRSFLKGNKKPLLSPKLVELRNKTLSGLLRLVVYAKLEEEEAAVKRSEFSDVEFFADRHIWLYYQNSQAGVPEGAKTVELASVWNLLARYALVVKRNEPLSYKQLGEFAGIKAPSTVQHILQRLNLPSLTRTVTRYARVSDEEKRCIKSLAATPFRTFELAYLLGHMLGSPRSTTTLDRIVGTQSQRPWAAATGAPGSQRVVGNYVTAMEIYKAWELGFSPSEIMELCGLSKYTVKACLKARQKAEPQIINVLDLIEPGIKHTSPYPVSGLNALPAATA